MKDAPELNVPEELASAGAFLDTCDPEISNLYSRIWTDINK
jgi:spermidine/putrescine transport system substrate-binding protein